MQKRGFRVLLTLNYRYGYGSIILDLVAALAVVGRSTAAMSLPYFRFIRKFKDNNNPLLKEQPMMIETKKAKKMVEVVNGRELHDYLDSGRDFSNWIKNRIEAYDFQEGRDFTTNLAKSTGGRPTIEYSLTLSMAKELCMVENNKQGRMAREYFIARENIYYGAANTANFNNRHQKRLKL
jgi:phage anti-repressor protein